jgi:hypothetical protein
MQTLALQGLYEVAGPHEPFLASVSPHLKTPGRTYAPDALRLVAQGDPHLECLYGIGAGRRKRNSVLNHPACKP